MEKIILVLIGIAAVSFVARLLWKGAKGEVQCHCAEGKCSSQKDPQSKEKK